AQQCGNGIQETIEQCDDGANNSDTEANRCRTNCTLPLGKPVVTPPVATSACGPRTEPLLIRNDGQGDFKVMGVELPEGAEFAQATLFPFTVAPSESQKINIKWPMGSVQAQVITDVVDAEIITVSIETKRYPNPTLELLTPAPNTIIPEATDYLLQARVYDERGDITTIAVTWLDQAGQLIGQTYPNSDGIAQYLWPATARTAGYQRISAKVSNSCGFKTSRETTICQEHLAKNLGIWLTPDGVTELLDEHYLGEITSYIGEESSDNNYNYYSSSAHPEIGPEPIGFETNVFFYEGADGLSFNFFSNLDAGGSTNSKVNWDIQTFGNANADKVILSDDPGELKRTVQNNTGHKYQARFHYWNNTDGGIIGPFNGTDYQIWINVLDSGDNTNAAFYSAHGTSFVLMSETLGTSFAIAFKSNRACEEVDQNLP
ncbi:MAG: hypothetical protein VYA34_02500, partial [Myxococcota bacterium]|nr:hypothetical protein [Myxococcota bacterium]